MTPLSGTAEVVPALDPQRFLDERSDRQLRQPGTSGPGG